MNVEMKVKIETENGDLELTKDQAKVLYEELKSMFDPKEITYVPYRFYDYPPYPLRLAEWQPVQPYYIGDVPLFNTRCVTYCGNTHEGRITGASK